jgi:hypothetical protein
MIEKDKGNPKITRLCIKHDLFEADYNFFLKLIWGCRMVGWAEDHGSLGEDMQGSRKNRGTMEMLLKKTMSFELCHQQQTNMALFRQRRCELPGAMTES